MNLLQLEIITPETITFSGKVNAVTAPAALGEITILPNHIPLFTKLNPGELRVSQGNHWQVLAVAGGFMDVAPQNIVTVLADSAVRVEEINVAKVEAAKRKAEERLQQKLSTKEFALAEADLRRTILELKVARKHHRQPLLEE